ADLVDEQGNAFAIPRSLRSAYRDTANVHTGVDWAYRPYDEIDASYRDTRIHDYLLNTALRYRIMPGIAAEIRYQYQQETSRTDYLNTEEAFYTRDLINRFFQPNASNEFPVPHASILRQENGGTNAHQGRAQL